MKTDFITIPARRPLRHLRGLAWVSIVVLATVLPVTSFAAPRIVAPVVIPGSVAPPAPASTATPERAAPAVTAPVPPPVVVQPVPVVPPPAPAAPVSTPPPAVPPQAPAVSLAPQEQPLEPEFAFASRRNAPVASTIRPAAPAPIPALDPELALERAEMYARMRAAVEKVSAEYGNPAFVQLFTNDPIRARVLRNRLQMLQSYEQLQAEIVRLEAARTEASQAVDAASQQRMAQIQSEIVALEQKRSEVARATVAAVQQQQAIVTAELAILEKNKSELTQEVSAMRAELKRLQDEADRLTQRIRLAQNALGAGQ